MPIQGVTNFTNPLTVKETATASSSGMDLNDFYELLAAQLKYQDADNPMDTSEMMAQMVQTQMISAITEMSQANVITYASSMVDKTVTVAEMDQNGMYTGENTTGLVTGVILGDSPIIFVDGNGYYLSQIMSIGETPESEATPEDGDTSEGEGSEGDTTVDGDTTTP